ncbi:MAG TPA: hypothetical protein ENI87_15285 [bacterium]|nr:hypothetical protein [bacterium]
MHDRQRIEEILHRVNNLLATIEVQTEVANTIGTQQAFADALRMIVESAQRTRAALSQRGDADEAS